ncbi:hypothetical protein [Pseudomonas putida]|uniref:hypothetical protein n=1 Tax=Pseudomonas putida TaxID=303 RepID=UPI0002820461|nr:hypothetical protein [Pseudomonas putida]EMR49353.1 hypothetical protein PPUTLS46_001772 [Pseudomonas putida LS46]
MNRDALQQAVLSVAALEDYLRNAKGMGYSVERYTEAFGLSLAEFTAQLTNYRRTQPGAATTPEVEAAQHFITAALCVVTTVIESGVTTVRAITWFREEPLLNFERRTAEQLVGQGQVEHVLQFLASWQAGAQG